MASRQGHQRHNLWRNDLCWLLWWGQRLLSGGFWGSSHDRNWGPVDPYRHRVSRLLMCKTRSARYLPPSGPNFRLDLLFHQRLEKQKEEKNTPFDDISYNIIKKYNTGDPHVSPHRAVIQRLKKLAVSPHFVCFVMGFMAIKKPNKVRNFFIHFKIIFKNWIDDVIFILIWP